MQAALTLFITGRVAGRATTRKRQESKYICTDKDIDVAILIYIYRHSVPLLTHSLYLYIPCRIHTLFLAHRSRGGPRNNKTTAEKQTHNGMDIDIDNDLQRAWCMYSYAVLSIYIYM